MSRLLPALLLLALGCASTGSTSGDGKAIYICHMGSDCGMDKVGPGDKIPSCCGKEMVKADTYACSCGKQQFIAVGKPAPACCGAAMKKAQP